MATWYLDYEGGSDNNGGDSFAVTLTATDGVANGTTTFTSATGGFTGMSGRKIFIVGKGGRTISSVTNDNTVVLNATVSSGSGLTFNVGGRRKLFTNLTTANMQGITGNDVVRVMGSPAPTSLSCVGDWRDLTSTIVMCGTSETVISDCETAWTASANVVATADATVFKVGTKSAKIDVATGFTTGLAAYFATGTLDLSSKQILKFYFRQSAGTFSTGSLQIKLCSDTAGVTAVNTFTLPAIGNRNSSGYNVWHPICIDLGSAMGASIQSVAFYLTVDNGAQTFFIDDIRACNSPNLTKSISTCETAWTASANVTTATSATSAQGTNSTSIAVAAAFTTGKAAYLNLGTTLDLSGYQQLSFFVRQTAGTLTNGTQASIKLCSDTTGDTPVNTIDIPSLTGSALNVWHRLTVNTGGALGASIQSIALYINTDVGAQTFLLDNIFAAKDPSSADAISLTSLIGYVDSIGAGGTDAETFYPISNIVNNTIILPAMGWTGVGDFKTIYKQETIKLPYVASSATAVETIPIAGSVGNRIKFEGGYDRTNMSTQNLQTWFDGVTQYCRPLVSSGGASSISFNRIGFVRLESFAPAVSDIYIDYCPGINGNGASGLNIGSGFVTFTGNYFLALNNNLSRGASIVGIGETTITTINMANNNNDVGVIFATTGAARGVINTINQANNNLNQGLSFQNLSSFRCKVNTINDISKNTVNGNIYITGCGNYIGTINKCNYSNSVGGIYIQNCFNCEIDTITECDRNAGYGIQITGSADIKIRSANITISSTGAINSINNSNDITIYNLTTSGNPLGINTEIGTIKLVNCNIAEATKVSVTRYPGEVYSFRHQQTNGAFSIFQSGGLITRDTTVNKSTGTASWKVSPTSTLRRTYFPLRLTIARFMAESGKTYTAQVYLLRDSSNVSARLVCRRNQLQGISSDITASNAAFVNSSTWEPLSISISPTETGVVELTVEVWGGTTNNAWFDDLTINNGTYTASVGLDYSDVNYGPGANPLANPGGTAGMLYIPNLSGLE